MSHAFQLTQNDDIAACFDLSTGVYVTYDHNAAFEFDLLTISQGASVEFCEVAGVHFFCQQFAQFSYFIVFCFDESEKTVLDYLNGKEFKIPKSEIYFTKEFISQDK